MTLQIIYLRCKIYAVFYLKQMRAGVYFYIKTVKCDKVMFLRKRKWNKNETDIF